MKFSRQPMKILDANFHYLMKIIRLKKLKHQKPHTKEYGYPISLKGFRKLWNTMLVSAVLVSAFLIANSYYLTEVKSTKTIFSFSSSPSTFSGFILVGWRQWNCFASVFTEFLHVFNCFLMIIQPTQYTWL